MPDGGILCDSTHCSSLNFTVKSFWSSISPFRTSLPAGSSKTKKQNLLFTIGMTELLCPIHLFSAHQMTG